MKLLSKWSANHLYNIMRNLTYKTSKKYEVLSSMTLVLRSITLKKGTFCITEQDRLV